MTVKQLKEYLEKLPDDTEIKFTTYKNISVDWVNAGPDELVVSDIGMDVDDNCLHIHLT